MRVSRVLRSDVALLCLLLVGCATTGATSGATSGPTPARVRFDAEGAVERTYRTDTPDGAAATGPDASAIEAAVARAGQTLGKPLTGDPRLASLAAWALSHQLDREATPPHALIDLWTHHLGLVEPAPHLLVLGVSGTGPLQDRVAEEIEAMLARHDYTHYGAATATRGNQHALVVALAWRWVSLAPVPRVVTPGATLTLRGRLVDGLVQPELAVTPPAGATWRRAAGDAADFDVALPLEVRGTHRIEILAHGAQGPTVVANFPVSVGVEPVTHVDVEVGGSAPDADDAVAVLVALVNRDRARAGLAPLALDDALSDVAHAHSEDMHANGFIAHTSPTTGSAADRVAAAGIRTRLVLENIGQGYGPQEVHEGLMQSPGHRESLLHPRATHLGIGIVTTPEDGQTRYLVTELFIRRAETIDVDAAPRTLLDRINERRATRGLTPLSLDAPLSEICARAAADYFGTNATHSALARRVSEEARVLRRPYGSLGATFVVVSSLEEALDVEGFFDAGSTGIGLGVAQGTRDDTEPNAIAIVAVLGRPR